MDRFIRTLWSVIAVLIAAGVAWALADGWAAYQMAVARRALDARAADLVQRALVPGSPLACLDAVANAAVETACEKVLFGNPETVAAAIAYVDAKLNLLAVGAAHAARDPAYADTLYRLRRGLEADRFGIVAQALASRGCTGEFCPALKLFNDPRRVASNLKERTFDANVVLHASAWRPENAAVAATPPSAVPAVPTIGLANGVPVSGKYDFPTAASIPPVSIMTAEPPLSKSEETAIATPAPAPPPEPAAAPAPAPAKKQQPVRRQQPASNVPLPPPAPIAPGAGLR